MDKSRFPLPDDDTKIYMPREIVAPVFESNVLTDNKTGKDGNVYNRLDLDAVDGRNWVDENHKYTCKFP